MTGAETMLMGGSSSVKVAPQENYEEQPRGFWSRLKERLGWGYYDDEEEVDYVEETGGRRRPSLIRVRQSRMNHVSIWMSIRTFENALQAADGLKQGHQQIVNLEKAAPEICARVIDFLSGVVYALDGFVEKAGEKVYLFTPCNYVIEVENGEERKVQSPFYEN